MTILRVDGWQVKPGRMAEVVEYARTMKPMIEKHGGASPRLMHVTVGGPMTGLTYGEFTVPDMQAYGSVISSLSNDPEVTQHIDHFSRSDGPVSSHLAGQVEVLAELGRRTESIPGCVELIQTFKIANEAIGNYLDRAGELTAFADKYNARLRVLRGLTGNQTGQVSIVVELANMAVFGAYAAETWSKQAFQDLSGRIRSIAEHLDGSLHAEVMT